MNRKILINIPSYRPFYMVISHNDRGTEARLVGDKVINKILKCSITEQCSENNQAYGDLITTLTRGGYKFTFEDELGVKSSTEVEKILEIDHQVIMNHIKNFDKFMNKNLSQR